jgi:hypothetical protein
MREHIKTKVVIKGQKSSVNGNSKKIKNHLANCQWAAGVVARGMADPWWVS